jgi:protein-L-isoaspartate O-methyltransferase
MSSGNALSSRAAAGPRVNMLRKIVAGGPGRPTRFHTERGEFMPVGELRHLPRAIAAWSLRRITGRRPDEPWWPIPVIATIERLLTPESRVLEFGSGSSSVWLARRAKSVVSVEDSPAWHRRVSERLASLNLENATVRLAEGHAFYDLSWAEGQFDFVVVDGSYRWRCIASALPLIAPGGALYFDNSDADKDLLLYPDRGMSRVAATMLEDYAVAHPGARLERSVSFISGELHAGEGMLLRLG